MESLLFLTHRIPFPPTKGDKVRSYHLLKFLASRYRIFLGTFIDSAHDRVYLASLEELCTDCRAIELRPAHARVRSMSGFLRGEALTLPYYRNATLKSWVNAVVREHQITKAVIFSSPMAQYVEDMPDLTTLVDFVDVDSAKWEQYGQLRSWPLSVVYRREAARLLEFERAVARQADAVLFVTAAEAAVFRRLDPQAATKIRVVSNGVDSAFFSPAHELPSPFPAAERPLVFTGAMDYWPNVDGARWFAQHVLPLVRARHPGTRLYLVGMDPSPAVRALSKHGDIVVTGRVPDVRPYLRHAQVVIAPVRVARGIQNKVLEAMAMAKPVVVSEAAAGGITARPGLEIEVASGASDFARKIVELFDSPRAAAMGRAARARVLADYDWESNLAPIDVLLRQLPSGVSPAYRDHPGGVARSATAA